MAPIDVNVTTKDGVAGASLHLPEGDGPWPGVILYPDAGSTRGVFRDMGDRLAGEGYAVLVPDVYYRAGDYEPFSITTVFTDPDELSRLREMAGALTGEKIAEDGDAYERFLHDRPEVAAGPIGTTGYCMGGRTSLIVAGALGSRVGAAASFHGGRLAVEDDPDSPHHLAGGVGAVVYVGAAADDASFDADQEARLHDAYVGAGVAHTIDHYDAGHGFVVPDNPTFDDDASERHWAAMTALFGSALG